MKLRIVICLVIAILTMTLLVFAGYLGASADTAIEAYVPDNLIRLHIVANSDSWFDQKMKQDVRDAMLVSTADLFRGLTSIDEAEKVLKARLNDVEAIARNVVASYGEDYPVKAELGIFTFPTKVYGDVVLPEGEYKALRIVLGEGQGENWWCVLFPPLCFINVASEAMTASEDFSLLSNEVVSSAEEDEPDDGRKNSIRWKMKYRTSLSFIQLLTTPLSYFYNMVFK